MASSKNNGEFAARANAPGADPGSAERVRSAMRWIMTFFYVFAGIAHVMLTEIFLMIVPDWVAAPRDAVLFTGVCEILGGIALIIPRLRRTAGIMLALYAVCVFPANLKHAFEGIHLPSVPDSWWYHGPRLLFQPMLIWWALFCAGVIDWPLKAKPDRTRTDLCRKGSV